MKPEPVGDAVIGEIQSFENLNIGQRIKPARVWIPCALVEVNW